MNERIKELARQAKLEDPSFPFDHWDNPELEKFALLIAKECIEVVDKRSKKNFHPTSFGGELLHYVTTDLKQHFGVEE